jgi:hypothetical protein
LLSLAVHGRKGKRPPDFPAASISNIKKKTMGEPVCRSAMVCVFEVETLLHNLSQGRRLHKAEKPKEKAKIRGVKSH